MDKITPKHMHVIKSKITVRRNESKQIEAMNREIDYTGNIHTQIQKECRETTRSEIEETKK